jgi:hypothetical protein
MSFMEPEVYEGSAWVVETTCGTEVIPSDLVGDNPTQADLRDYCEGAPQQHGAFFVPELAYGWFARLSAPGYMDCAAWTGPFDTEGEAEAYLSETYGTDEDSEEIA